jgi:hypothetical protein
MNSGFFLYIGTRQENQKHFSICKCKHYDSNTSGLQIKFEQTDSNPPPPTKLALNFLSQKPIATSRLGMLTCVR